MEHARYCIEKYRKLINLLDEEIYEMRKFVQGDILEAYLRILQQEKSSLTDAMNSMKSYY